MAQMKGCMVAMLLLPDKNEFETEVSQRLKPQKPQTTNDYKLSYALRASAMPLQGPESSNSQ